MNSISLHLTLLSNIFDVLLCTLSYDLGPLYIKIAEPTILRLGTDGYDGEINFFICALAKYLICVGLNCVKRDADDLKYIPLESVPAQAIYT
jgi:hypothetical protein